MTKNRLTLKSKRYWKICTNNVAAGGVTLKEVDFKTMQSKKAPNLYFAGEVLNIDAITGGFNFQAAWTTAWVVAQSV